MIVVIVVVMVLAFAGAIAYGVKSKWETSAEAEAAGTGPNEFLAAPPTSFPTSRTAPDVAGSVVDEIVDEIDSRFRSPGSRSIADPAPLEPIAAPRPMFHLEGAPEPEPEVVDDGVIIDLVDTPAPETPASELDLVDHVLQALITRARFKQVGVEEVATELVERADLRGEDVSVVLAELVGRADGVGLGATSADATPTSELTLFNDEVPSRPGQLTDFARLAPGEKKRIIIRVLCLLVARSEDQQLPPRADADGAAPKSWPLARVVWPLADTGDDDGEPQLPSRRLAKSG
jgi:hypothetical protein